MKKVILTLVAVLATAFAASAAEYTCNDSAIDALVENAVEVSLTSSDLMAELPAAPSAVISSVDPTVATLLCFFLGGFGIHRHYMGTSKWMWALYTFTFYGIFGIVPLVDFVVLLMNLVEDKGIGQYCGSTKFLMWA